LIKSYFRKSMYRIICLCNVLPRIFVVQNAAWEKEVVCMFCHAMRPCPSLDIHWSVYTPSRWLLLLLLRGDESSRLSRGDTSQQHYTNRLTLMPGFMKKVKQRISDQLQIRPNTAFVYVLWLVRSGVNLRFVDQLSSRNRIYRRVSNPQLTQLLKKVYITTDNSQLVFFLLPNSITLHGCQRRQTVSVLSQ